MVDFGGVVFASWLVGRNPQGLGSVAIGVERDWWRAQYLIVGEEGEATG